MRKILLLSMTLAFAAPAAPAAADPWADLRLVQAPPHLISPQRPGTARDYDRPPAGRRDIPAPQALGYQNDFGGGFIEFLFTGRVSPPNPNGALPRQHYLRPQYETDRSWPFMQTRQDRPDYGAYSQQGFDPRFARQRVMYNGREAAGTIIIDSTQRFLFLVEENGMAIRYGVGVGRDGFGWSGVKTVSSMREWPDWRPPEEMLRRRPELPRYMAGGPDNPLGARALYLGDSLYRIHGSNEPHTIGQAVSSGCFRMRNEDVIDLYNRVRVGTRVVVI